MADKITETASDSAQCVVTSLLESKSSDLEAKIDSLAADVATLAARVERSSRSQVRAEADKNRKRFKSRRSSVY